MLVFGTAIGNTLVGFPYHFEWNMTSVYTGSFISLFNPFAILAGLLSVSMAIYMGAAMLMNRAEGAMHARSKKLLSLFGILALVLFSVGGIWVANMKGYVLHNANAAGDTSPLHHIGTIDLDKGGWLANYSRFPVLWLLPLLTYISVILGIIAARKDKSVFAWWMGALGWIGILGTVGAAMFPLMMPSSSNPAQSLTVWNASSSKHTLVWMTGWTIVFVPTVLTYTSWAFWVMRGKVKANEIESDDHAY